MKRTQKIMKFLAVTFALLLAVPAGSFAQAPSGQKAFSQAELDQIMAPIALYPDDVLSQILIASTYPLEIVQADRWAKQNSKLKGDALTAALEKQNWDPSVKSLVNFPQVLAMMSEKVDWTEKVGNAFLSQEKDVMNSIQRLRSKAQTSGNLKSTPEQKVIVEKETIVIQQANPQVVYVPTYTPTVVYGAWPYPAYPPAYYYPPGYVAGTAAFSFAAGVAVGAAWGYAWGHSDWHGGTVHYNVTQNININNNIDRSKYQQNINRNGQRGSQGTGNWQHDPSHRKGVAYRDQATAQRYNKAASPNAVKSRENYRGRSEAVQKDLARTGPGRTGASRDTGRTATGRQESQAAGSRGAAQRGGQAAGAGTREAATRGSGRANAFEGMDRGSAARDSSSRGRSSRESMSRSSGGFGGASRGGGFGGGGRGGGGRRR